MIAKMRNGGEACTAANRFYVEESVAESFAAELAEKMGAMKVGPGHRRRAPRSARWSTTPPCEKVDELVSGALDGGARALVGGAVPDRTGCYYDPTVLVDVPADAAILREEIFGPVAPIVTFTDEAEAVRWANDTEFGLVVLRLHRRPRARLRVSEALESGMVGLNRGLVSDPAAPVRRRQAVRHRPRGRARGPARLHREQVHRRRLVTLCCVTGAVVSGGYNRRIARESARRVRSRTAMTFSAATTRAWARIERLAG